MSDFKEEMLTEISKSIQEDSELVLLLKITDFANWLEEGASKTQDPMVIRVLENYIGLFGEYLSKADEENE